MNLIIQSSLWSKIAFVPHLNPGVVWGECCRGRLECKARDLRERERLFLVTKEVSGLICVKINVFFCKQLATSKKPHCHIKWLATVKVLFQESENLASLLPQKFGHWPDAQNCRLFSELTQGAHSTQGKYFHSRSTLSSYSMPLWSHLHQERHSFHFLKETWDPLCLPIPCIWWFSQTCSRIAFLKPG